MKPYGESECPEHFWIMTYRSSSPVLVCFLLLLPLIAATVTFATMDCKEVIATRCSDPDEADSDSAGKATRIDPTSEFEPLTRVDVPAASPWDLSRVAKRDPWLALARCIVIETAIRQETQANKANKANKSSWCCAFTNGTSRDFDSNQENSNKCGCSNEGWKSLLCQCGWVFLAVCLVMSYPTIARTAFLYSRTCVGSSSPCTVAGPPAGHGKEWAYVYCTYCKIAIDKTPIG